MRAVLVIVALILTGCAAEPEPREARVSLAFADVTVGDAVMAIVSQARETVEVAPDAIARVSGSFRRVPPGAALAVLAWRTQGTVWNLGFFQRSRYLFWAEAQPRADVPLIRIAQDLAASTNEHLVLASDVERHSPIDPSRLGAAIDGDDVLGTALAPFGIHACRVGAITVLSSVDLGSTAAVSCSGPSGVFLALHAPAAAWFALLERVTGRRFEHGDAPIDVDLWSVRGDEVAVATALASRAPHPKKPLEDMPPSVTLPSGRVIAVPLQATFVARERALALIDGRILEPGDTLVSGVSIGIISTGSLQLLEGDRSVTLEVPRTGP